MARFAARRFAAQIDLGMHHDADGAGGARVDGVGPVAPQWCSDDALRAIAMVPDARRVHAHLLESARQRLAPDTVARMERAGLLSPASSFAHGIWLDDAQMRRLARAGSTIVHCPGSNARLGAGTCGAFHGVVDEVRLYDRAIDTAEITRLAIAP